ncbi:hypothetical protein [Streptomyces xiamenensis]|uniref:hypothetical protein n=1 Tax=Streptomyces xiamenensis TaxID=408015 RepID=UPI0037D75966
MSRPYQETGEGLRCPIEDCTARVEEWELHEHLEDEHERDELIDCLVQLAPDLPYHRDVECEMCGACGARPGDHPLCESCETRQGWHFRG